MESALIHSRKKRVIRSQLTGFYWNVGCCERDESSRVFIILLLFHSPTSELEWWWSTATTRKQRNTQRKRARLASAIKHRAQARVGSVIKFQNSFSNCCSHLSRLSLVVVVWAISGAGGNAMRSCARDFIAAAACWALHHLSTISSSHRTVERSYYDVRNVHRPCLSCLRTPKRYFWHLHHSNEEKFFAPTKNEIKEVK